MYAAAASLLLASVSFAQPEKSAYPDKTISVVVPFGAGGGTDAVARVLVDAMGKELGRKILIDNRGGANGSIGSRDVAKAKPDGYTLLMTTSTTHAANPSLLKSLSYDPIKDFTPIGRIGYFPFVLAIDPHLPAHSVQDFINLAKKEPGKLSYAQWQGTTMVAGATFEHITGANLLSVPYGGTTQALTDVLGGRISAIFIDVPSGIAHFENGQLRALAVTTPERSSLLPKLPTLSEAGVPGFNVSSWMAFYGPANLPKEIVEKLNGAMRSALTKSNVKQRLISLGFDISPTSAQELATYNVSEIAHWKEMVKEAGIKPQ